MPDSLIWAPLRCKNGSNAGCWEPHFWSWKQWPLICWNFPAKSECWKQLSWPGRRFKGSWRPGQYSAISNIHQAAEGWEYEPHLPTGMYSKGDFLDWMWITYLNPHFSTWKLGTISSAGLTVDLSNLQWWSFAQLFHFKVAKHLLDSDYWVVIR